MMHSYPSLFFYLWPQRHKVLLHDTNQILSFRQLVQTSGKTVSVL